MFSAQKNNWIGNSKAEIFGILSVPFLCVLTLGLVPNSLLYSNDIPEYLWFILVVFIDVGHVYSTLYRTYADKELVLKHKPLFFGLPFLLFIISILLHSMDGLLFWRCLAYFAVFHFIRQQYGFMKIYSRKNNYNVLKQRIDSFTTYAITILPVIYWHLSNDRNFNWFLKGDFLVISDAEEKSVFILALLVITLVVYLISEVKEFYNTKIINYQKNAIVVGTALSWYLGIVYFNSDFVFSILNIVCHGIPYITLVWIYGKKTFTKNATHIVLKSLFGKFSALIFLLPIFVFAYIEEGLWDLLIWKEHHNFFIHFKHTSIEVSKSLINIIVPLLALPQLFHYVIDGFIWKLRHDKYEWTHILEK